MIEYLYNAIRATAGEEITLAARITDESGIIAASNNHLSLYSDAELLGSYDGVLIDDVWQYTIPAEATKNLKGRYWYCICESESHTKLQFKEPIYLV